MSDDTSKEEFRCAECDSPVAVEDEFCPSCGALFTDGIHCLNHGATDAEGVCIVCCSPFCKSCGKRSSGMFLCEPHQKYEIYQGMARVHGTNDEATAQYLCDCLKQQGLHAFVFSRKSSPVTFGGPDYTMFNAAGDYLGRIINEFKVMVPTQQVLDAERLIEELTAHDTHAHTHQPDEVDPESDLDRRTPPPPPGESGGPVDVRPPR